MNRLLIVLLAVCSLTAAMVPRHRRAFNLDEEELKRQSTEHAKEVCEPRTPCAWTVYRPKTKIIEINITNSYCTCPIGQKCKESEDDMQANAIVHLCSPIHRPVRETVTPES